MSSPAYHNSSTFIMDIGGDHGMDAGIDLSIMIEVGVFFQGFHFGIAKYPILGGRTTEPICGAGIHGIITI